jgi:hypothetical protein
MRLGLFLPLFGLGLLEEALSSLRASTQTSRREDPDETLDEIGQELDDAGNKFEKARKRAFRHAQRGPGDAKKPMMDSVEVMRTMVCWGRKKLLEHDDCMAWLVENCKEKTSGDGYCRKFRRYLKSKCRRGNQKGCDYAHQMGLQMEPAAMTKEDVTIHDEDGDGVQDSEDAFPENPLEQKDTDGDRIGDNFDEWPEDPSRAHPGEKPAAPSPAMPAAPAAPTGLSMKVDVPLPSQGFNEHSVDYVSHTDGKTMTKDWHREWPMSDESDEETFEDICAQNPHHTWCKLKRSRAARRAYVNSHP